jgi:hypothetical protein
MMTVAARFPREVCKVIANITITIPKAVTIVVGGTPKIARINKPVKN